VGFYNVVNAGSLISGQPEDISQVLANFNAIAAVLNGGLDNSNVAGAAAIAYSKLALSNSIKNADVDPAAAIEASKLNWHVGASPPGSPTSGMLWIYQGSGFYWFFVYDSTETTYKWKFVGGPPLVVVSDVQRATSGASLWFADPVLTTPRAGDYACTFWADVHDQPNSNTGVSWQLYLGDGSSVFTPTAGWRMGPDFQAGATSGTFWRYSPSLGPRVQTGLAASTTLKIFGTPVNWNFTTDVRGIAVVPLRVS
jgi:hypothetical protein